MLYYYIKIGECIIFTIKTFGILEVCQVPDGRSFNNTGDSFRLYPGKIRKSLNSLN